jgi:hypothetical protein
MTMHIAAAFRARAAVAALVTPGSYAVSVLHARAAVAALLA